jgi:outer membrane protein assembly factor BamB
MPEQPLLGDLVPHRIAVRTATAAAIFSFVVAALMLYDFMHRPMKDPFTMKDPTVDSPRDVLKLALKQQPANESIKEEIRKLDQRLREEHFRQKAFEYSGAGLLCGGIIICLAACKWAATLQRKHPQPPVTAPSDWEASWTPAAKWTVGGLFVVLAATAVALSLPLRTSVAETSDGTMAAAVGGGESPEKAATEKATAAGKTTAVTKSDGENKTATTGKAAPIAKATTAEKTAATEKPATTAVAESPTTASPPKAVAISQEAMASAWPCFRGRGGSGISPYSNVPDDWDGPSGKNIVWKSPIPLAGNSSPVVVAGRIFVTGADENQRKVYCYEAKSGKLLWQQDAPSTPDSKKPLKLNDDTGYAACTTVSDGRYVAAIYANGDLCAFDLDGKLAWSQSLGIPDNPYGHAASLSIYKNLVLVPFDQATAKAARSKLRALDIATGHPVWEQTRAVPSSWTTPIVIQVAGRDEVVTAASPWVIAYDPAGGKELWRVKGSQGDVAPSPVPSGNVVIAAANDSAPILAIRADGSGDVTSSHILWKGEDNTPDICSPLATEEFVFLLGSEGMLTCYDAHKGEKLWEEDLNDFKCKSSPSLVGKQLYVFGEAGKCWILEPTRKGVKRVRQTDLGEGCVTCPAFQDGRIFVRGKKNLICIGLGK